MDIGDFILKNIPVILLELIAAIAGVFYVRKVKPDKGKFFFVIFLWFTLVVDMMGSYSGIAYFTEYKVFGFVKGTVFSNNYWLFNIYILVSNLFFIWFFRNEISNNNYSKLLLFLSIVMAITVTIDFFMGNYFHTISRVSTIFGSLLMLLAILLFYMDLLASEKLLSLKYNLPFYISVVLLIHTLCTTPLDFLSNYFKTSTGNDLFVSFRVSTFFFLNILLYLTYTIAFIQCSRKKHLSY